jgi:hypothetical protein
MIEFYTNASKGIVRMCQRLISIYFPGISFTGTGIITRNESEEPVEVSVLLTIILHRVFLFVCLFVIGTTAPHWARASSFTRFLDYTQRRITVGRTPLDE